MGERKILREWLPLERKEGGKFLIEDARASGGRLVLSGPMQRAEAPNQNKRIYPRRILQREFENYMKVVRENRAMGELDHPETSTVSLEKVSHLVREMWWDGDTWMGRIEVLPTPMGKILESLVDSGVTLGISSRGVGSTMANESGLDLVKDDFTLICFDMVAEPSTHGAYMFAESVDKNRGAVLSRPDRIARALNELKAKGDK
jgi:hypothetical protein